MAHNVQRIPAAGGLYGPGYVPITNYTANTAALAALQKNAAVAAAAYGGYAGYAVPQAFPATAFQLPIHDVYQTYWLRGSDPACDWTTSQHCLSHHVETSQTWARKEFVANIKSTHSDKQPDVSYRPWYVLNPRWT